MTSCWQLQLAAVAVAATLTSSALGDGPAPAALPTVDIQLHDGDRVLFFGDSITEQGFYVEALEAFLRIRSPRLVVTFINSGWSGDKAWGGEGGGVDERLRRDVVAHRPTIVAVMFGMNDAYYSDYDPKSASDFSKNLDHIVDVLQKDLPGVRIAILGSSPYDNVTPAPRPDWEKKIDGGYNAVVRRFGDAARDVARKRGLLFVDFNSPLVQVLERANRLDPKLAEGIVPDRIHPSPQAGLVMAALLAKAWHVAERRPSVAIDAAATGRAVAAESNVTNMVRSEDGLTWNQRDAVLPLPIDGADPLTALVVACSPELRSLASQTLRIENLPAEAATLSIDGAEVCSKNRDEWAKGVDLSALSTPMGRQAASVARTLRIRSRASFIGCRRLQMAADGKHPAALDQTLDELGDVERRLDELATSLAEPEARTLEIRWPHAGGSAASPPTSR